MQHLLPEAFDPNFYYHRTSSATYRAYLESCGLITYDIGSGPQFAWKKRLPSDTFCIVRYERTDVEPDIEYLKNTLHIKHAFVTWIPHTKQAEAIGRPWRRLYMTDHFQETGYTTVDENYRAKWNERARRALKKYEKSGATVRAVTPEEFVLGFRSTRVRHWFKGDYISYYKKMVSLDASKIRQWLCYSPDGEVVAGLAVHDFIGDHSVHMVAFTGKKAYPLQWGTALIDTWFRESIPLGVKYISFDQLRNKHGPGDQKGYTEFKNNFIEYRMSFPKAYFRLF